ncbi:hypothetical protein EASAB2608_00206 [Streptomyces sp. EAS-AB2608]|nr:hypothetical protein EASAB2608_00206 [Streptomyces sp. EAS-AB2608]
MRLLNVLGAWTPALIPAAAAVAVRPLPDTALTLMVTFPDAGALATVLWNQPTAGVGEPVLSLVAAVLAATAVLAAATGPTAVRADPSLRSPTSPVSGEAARSRPAQPGNRTARPPGAGPGPRRRDECADVSRL